MFKKLLVLIFILGLSTSLIAKDIVMQIERRIGGNDEGSETPIKVYISGEKVTIKTPSHDKYFIYRGDEELIWLVDPANQAYVEINQAFVDSLGMLQNELLHKAETAIQNMPPPQKAVAQAYIDQIFDRYEGMLGKKKDSLVYQPAGYENINDYPCKKWQAYKDSILVCELWVSDWNNIEYSEEIRHAYTSMAEFVATLKRTFDDNVIYISFLNTPFDHYDPNSSNGMPISSISYDKYHTVIHYSTLMSIEGKELSENIFSIPEEYHSERPELPDISEINF